MSNYEIADYACSFSASLVCFWVGYHRGKRASLLRNGILTQEAFAEWKRKYNRR